MAPSAPSRLAVHVVLRTSTSISPDCSAVNRSSVSTSTNLDLGRVAEHGGGDHPAEVGVEADVLAGSSSVANPGRSSRVPHLNVPAAWTASSVDPDDCTSSTVSPGAALPAGASLRRARRSTRQVRRRPARRSGGVAGGIVVTRAARGEHEDRYER